LNGFLIPSILSIWFTHRITDWQKASMLFIDTTDNPVILYAATDEFIRCRWQSSAWVTDTIRFKHRGNS